MVNVGPPLLLQTLGRIPPELGSLIQLNMLYLSDNKLSGEQNGVVKYDKYRRPEYSPLLLPQMCQEAFRRRLGN